jgi:hypothetical protein
MSGHAMQQPTIQQLKKRALELAELPRNRGWFELSQVLELLHRRDRAEFQDLIHPGALGRRTAFCLRKVGQLIRTAKLSTYQAERIGWTKLQIVGDKLNGKNAARLLKLAEENNAQELRRLVNKKRTKSKPNCVQLYLTNKQYEHFKKGSN